MTTIKIDTFGGLAPADTGGVPNMKTYTVTHRQTGAVVYRYSADAPIEWVGMEFATHDHAEVIEQQPVAPVTVEDRRITRLAFRNRFTQSEKAAIEIAALDNPSAPMAQRAQSAALRASMKDQEVASFIDLSRPDTRAGVQQLEAAGLIAQGRAVEILDGPIADIERYREAVSG